MSAFCDLIFDSLESTTDKIIKNPSSLIQDFKATAGNAMYSTSYNTDHLKKRITSQSHAQMVVDIIKLISKARTHNCSSNLSAVSVNLSKAILAQSQ